MSTRSTDSQHRGPLVVHGQGKKHHEVISTHKTRGFILPLWFKRGEKNSEKLVSSTATSKIGTVFQAFINQIKHMQFKWCFPCHINILMNIHQWVELKIYWRFACLIIFVEFCNWKLERRTEKNHLVSRSMQNYSCKRFLNQRTVLYLL